MSAVTERERRETAGRRMSSLVGKAADDDDAFWSHDVWADENDSGNDSFRESDEDSDQRVDRFDSDFDDSESDNEADELAAGAAEEEELQRLERNSNRKNHVDIANAGRDLLKKKKGTSRKRKKDLMGDGFNAGLVLNLPTSAPAVIPAPSLGAPAPSQQLSPKHIKGVPTRPEKQLETLASTRSLRSTQAAARRNLRARSKAAATLKAAPTRQSTQQSSQQGKKRQRRFTQEELLLEAATVTEPENERWLLGRKRVQDLENLLSARDTAGQRDARGGKVVSKFYSRRGCLNTLTFPEMDAVPAILTKVQTKKTAPRPTKKKVCVITGKPARYRDPKTNMEYYDLEAFKELRRRLQAGEPIDQRKLSNKKEKEESAESQSAKNDKKEKVDSGPSLNGRNDGIVRASSQSLTNSARNASLESDTVRNGSRDFLSKKSSAATSLLAHNNPKHAEPESTSAAIAASTSLPPSKSELKGNPKVNKSRKSASPTTSSLIHNALAAYTQLKHDN